MLGASTHVTSPEVRVYSRDLQLSLRQTKKPLHSAPLRGTRDLSAAAAPSARSSPAQRAEEYTEMMHTIVERARRGSAETEAREDEDLERMLRKTEREETGFVRDLGTFIEAHEDARLQQKAQLCRDWHERVYGAVQSQVDAQLARLSSRELTARRNELMESYIRTSNAKVRGLYRDIILPAEYDPMMANEMGIKYSSAGIRDPLKAELDPAQAPSRSSALAGGRVVTGSPLVGRPMLDVTMWGQLEATCFGRVAPPKLTSAADLLDARDATASLRGLFDHYAPASPDLSSEFPAGGKRTFAQGRAHGPF